MNTIKINIDVTFYFKCSGNHLEIPILLSCLEPYLSTALSSLVLLSVILVNYALSDKLIENDSLFPLIVLVPNVWISSNLEPWLIGFKFF